MSVLVACNNVNAQTLESITQQRKSVGECRQIMIGETPSDMQINYRTNKIYVTDTPSNSVSIIDSGSWNTKSIRVGLAPRSIAIDTDSGKIYVTNAVSNSVSVIDGYNDSKIKDIPVGRSPDGIATDISSNEIYVTNHLSNTVSVINGSTDTKVHDIHVGNKPWRIAIDDKNGNLIYVLGSGGVGTIAVIDGSSDKVAAGIIFNVKPADSGKVVCNNAAYPINTYVYADAGTNCMAQPNKDFEFNTWVESPLTNRNSSIPIDSSGNLTVNRYGVFTVNFKPLPPTIPPEYLYLIISVIVSSVIGWSIPNIFGWFKARKQHKHLKA